MCYETKHAYLILAHNNFDVLRVLLKLLDDSENDIYIHIDKKITKFDFSLYKSLCKYSPVCFTPERASVCWGRKSLIDAELLLFSEAHTHRHYTYYHLISGVDLPLKTQETIHRFFQGSSENYIHLTRPSKQIYERLSLYHLITARSILAQKTEKLLLLLQRAIGINRFRKWEKKGYTFEYGSQWVSLTNEAVEALLSERNTIKKMTRFSLCPDEEYKQIVLRKSGLPIFRGIDGETNNMRCIDWSRGNGIHPYVFRKDDYELLLASDKLFARKFDKDIDFKIVETIQQKISQNTGDSTNRRITGN